jgi:hypothetical protein
MHSQSQNCDITASKPCQMGPNTLATNSREPPDYILDVPENIPMAIRDRSAPNKKEEVEITPEMIEAGVAIVRDFEPDQVSPWTLVEAVYRAMAAHAVPSS